MRNALTAILFVLFALLPMACNNPPDYNELLVRACTLMEVQPDSALHILQNLPSDSLRTEADSAFYALLMTQAQDKCFIFQTNDSLIRSAVAYYDKTRDKKMRAKAYYYLGCIYRDSQKEKEALTQYLKAQSLAEDAEDKHLLRLIYSNIGLIYYKQDLNTQADSIYQLVEEIAIELKDTLLQAEVLAQRGTILMETGEEFYPEAEDLLLEALELSEKFTNVVLKGNVLSSLSTLYYKMDNGKKAVEYAQKNLAIQQDSTERYVTYSLLGNAYYKLSQYDSAHYYLQKGLQSSDYAIKAGAYMHLADIAKEQNDLETSLEMERNYSAYLDSLRRSRHADAIISVEKDMQISRQQEKYEALINRNIYYFLIIAVCTLILIGIVAASYLIKRKKKQSLQIETEVPDEVEIDILEQSDVYKKIDRIILSYKDNDQSEERMYKEDWLQLITNTDMCRNNITQKLASEFNLTEDEIHLCCLYLTDLPVSHFCHLLNCTRDTVYKKANRILEQKMGLSHKETSLKEVLKKLG